MSKQTHTHNRICGIRSKLIISFIKNIAHIQFHTQYGCEKNTSAEMATLTRSKSPRPGQSGGKQPDKEESFWDKIGTLGRKKRIKEGRAICSVSTHSNTHAHTHMRNSV